jgi:hypothetical protein
MNLKDGEGRVLLGVKVEMGMKLRRMRWREG